MLLSSSTKKGEIERAFPYFMFWMMMTTLCWSNPVLNVSGSRRLGSHRKAILSCRKRSKTESPMLFISLVVGNPYYQEGILIRKNWGNLFTYTFITPPLSLSGVREREFSLYLPLSIPAHCFCPAVVPLSGAVVPLGLVAHQLCSSGCTAASGRWYRHHALQQLGRWFRPCTAQVPLSLLV